MKQRPKVAIITPGSHPIPDPNSTSVETIVHQITTMIQDDVDFTIFGKKVRKHPTYEKAGKLTYIRFPYKGAKSYIKQVAAKLQETDTDIIQVENRPKYIKHLRGVFPKKQLWLFLHSTFFIMPDRISKEELLQCINVANKILVNSQYMKNYLVEYTGCDKSKVTVNHYGIDINQFKSKWDPTIQKDIKQFKQSLGIEKKKVVLYVGRLKKIKGVHHLLNVFPNILKQMPNTDLFVVGSAFFGLNKETRYVKKLHQTAEDMSDSIHFIPYVPHNEIQKWFQIADIIVVPSKAEPFGLVNIEAMATGVTVVATNAGGIPEIIKHEKTGVLLDPNSVEKELSKALIDLLSNPTKVTSMGKAAIQHVHHNFTWEHSANRMLQLYKAYSFDQ
ncbi:spore coat protein SA [Desulfitispora alkaliphila]|uniref:glycosyltransferase family 4 protein n=1 Tax=Desulfitispora alkaliphila TaxID=622674 RepID=UPI003D1EB8EA